MKKKYTFRKWIALFLSIAMIAASGITTNLHMRAADSTEVEETAKGDAADGTVASGVDSRTAGGEAERGKTEESSQAGGEAAGEAEAGKGGVTAADAGEAAGAAKSGDASAAGEAQGASAASDAEKKEALSEQEQIDQAREGATNTTYSYQDDNITVTAVLDSANAVPDNAKFRVTPITKETAGYNYNAYMDALNDDAAASSDSAAEKQYTGENTLLYDMAFLYEVNVQKEDGSTEQKEVEVQPAEGAVKISVDFKKGQLTDTLDAKSDADVEIKHLPLTDRVKESTDTTAAATDITASDIRVEDVSGADVSVDSQKAEFKADAFSAYAFVQDGSEVTDIKPGTARTAEDVLQDAAYYGITAEKLTQKGHMDSNFAAITYDNGGANFTLGAYTNKKRPGQILAGQVVNELKITTDNPVIVRTPLANEEKIHEGRDKAIVVNTTEEEVGNRVREMLEKVESAGQEMLSEKSYSIEIKNLNDFNNNDHATIDFTKYGSGTFYIDGDSFFSNTSIPYDFKINKNDDQVIVFNFKSETPKFRKFFVNGVQSTTSDASADRYARTILFNMPNATSVSWEGGIFGTVLAPNATVSKFGGTSSGWLVAKDVTVSDGEWHCVYQDMPEYQVETGYSLHAEKLVDHETPEINGFTFSLERKNGDKWEQVAQTVNDGRNVNFSDLQAGFDENRSGIEYITYRISEPQNQTVDGAEYAADGATAYYAKVAVRNTVRYENNKKIKGAEAEVLGYYSDENCTEKTDTPAFNNTRHKTGSASVTMGGHKYVEGIENSDKVFRFTLSENGQVIDTKTVTGEGDYRFDPITYTEAGDHTYTVAETAGDAAGYTYDAKTYEVKVSVTDDKNGQLQASISGDTTTGADLDFTNRYQAIAASARIGGSKTINGSPDKITAGQFRFELIENGQVIDTATNDTAGNYVFGRISYPTVGTHIYTVIEQDGGRTVNGIKYDAEPKNITITVTDDGSGTLKANGAADYSVTTEPFNNIRYGSIHVNKSWDDAGNSDQRPSSITVDLIDTETRETVQRAELSADNNWSADFGQLEAGRHYTVHEEPAGEYYTAQNNDQVVTADISGSAVTLINTFTHPSVNIYANKVLNGGTLTNGEFTFNLYRNSDPDTVVQTAVNNVAGEIFFTGIAYDASGYTVKEAAGTDSSITYDKAAVTYDAEGNITSADHTEFTNTQRPIVLRVQKRSKAAPYDPLEGAAYGLYQVVPGGNDILIELERSDKNGYMYYGKIEPDTLYYFREISAPEGHEVDPYAGVKFQVKYTGSGEIGIFDENGDPTTVGDITSQGGKALLVQHTSEKTAIPGSASLTYSDDRIVAAAEAPEGAFDAGTTMRVTQLSGDDVKDATAIVEAACGKIKNTVAYYNVGFVDAKGNAVEPKTGDVTVTIQYRDSLNMPEGTDVSALRIVHLKQSGGETGVQAVEGTIASASGELLQTSFTTDSFSTFGIVEPSESSSLNSSYLVTAAGVADQVSKLKVAKLDTSGKYVKGAKLQIIEKATGTVKAEWNTADRPEEFARWFDDAKTVSMNVDTDYILHEVSAPEGYELADDILFRINRYDSSITICKYDGSGKLVPDQEAIDKWVSDATIQMIDVPVVHSKKTTVKQRVVGNERTIQGSDRVVRVSGAKAVKTGDTAQTELFAILFAAAVGVLLVLVLLRRKHENDK